MRRCSGEEEEDVVSQGEVQSHLHQLELSRKSRLGQLISVELEDPGTWGAGDEALCWQRPVEGCRRRSRQRHSQFIFRSGVTRGCKPLDSSSNSALPIF